ncbi:MAG: glycosyltransferase family A protein [Candidatus Omnitrophota bacterium]
MISIVIPTYNRALFLKRAIESVLDQTYKDFELIVVDDGSQDETRSLVDSYPDDRIKCLRQDNLGPSSARNLGIKKAQGAFVAFLDSDDRWDKEKLWIQLGEMENQPTYLVSHTQEIWYKNRKILNQKNIHKKHHGYIFDRCLNACVVSMSTAMIRKELLERVGFFDEGLPCCEDYDFWLRVSVEHPFLLIDKPLTSKEGGHKDQVSYLHRVGMDKFRITALQKLLDESDLDDKQTKLLVDELSKKCRIYGTGCIKHGKEEEGKYYLDLKDSLRKKVF